MSDDDVSSIDASWLRSFRSRLKRWYQHNARDLPWRRTHDPYHIWISEIMLQQTTVAAVVPYFERFLERFPIVQQLAEADESDVLRLWEGLGYYSRARNIHKAAKIICEKFGGTFPQAVQELQALPGIGRYTAGAIASFAFDIKAPIVEANTLRLYCRLMGYEDDPRSTAGQQRLWNFAERIVPKSNPGQFNQALMELGGTICSVKEPDCQQCPVSNCCRAFADSTQHQIPQPKKRTQFTELNEVTVAVCKNDRFLLRRREESERWAGLWDFPRFELQGIDVDSLKGLVSKRAKTGPLLFPEANHWNRYAAEVIDQVKSATGVSCDLTELASVIRHGVTRYRITLLCFRARFVSGRISKTAGEVRWFDVEELRELPLSVTGRKFANLLIDQEQFQN